MEQDSQDLDNGGRHAPKFGIFHGLGIFIVALAALYFAAAPIQRSLGMAGLAITEGLMLLIAVAACLLFHQPLREVFPFRKPQGRHVAGTLLLWMGFFGISIYITMVLSYFFPQDILEINKGMSSFMDEIPFLPQILIMALLPAICEEMLFRGVIQYAFRKTNRWVIVSAVGLMFGICHMDPLRLLPTAILGVGLALVMLKTRNMLLPMLYHFFNNFLSALISQLSGGVDMNAAASSLASLTPPMLLFMMIYAAASPLCLLLGGMLLDPRDARHIAPRKWAPIVTIVTTALLVIGTIVGFVMLFSSALETFPELPVYF